MELLCPNCQKKVTVSDEYAGQAMKCPHCNGTFTTPSLAPAPGPAFLTPPAAVSPVKPLATAPPPAPRADSAGSPGVDVAIVEGPPPRVEAAASGPAAPEPVVADYRHRGTIRLNPRVLPWFAVAALVAVFILLYFPWAGYYPGGVTVARQTGWQAAFGLSTFDADLVNQAFVAKDGKDLIEPGANGLLIVFVLVFLIALLAAMAAAVLGVVAIPLPAAVAQLKPWRWAIVAGITLLALLFFSFQLLAGLSLKNRFTARLESVRAEESKTAPTPADKKTVDVDTGMRLTGLHYTGALWAAFWLTMLAVVFAALTHILGRRTARPLPRIDFLW